VWFESSSVASQGPAQAAEPRRSRPAIQAFTAPISAFTMPIPVFTMADFRVHDADLGVHTPPILAFTLGRFSRSRSAVARSRRCCPHRGSISWADHSDVGCARLYSNVDHDKKARAHASCGAELRTGEKKNP
jgi:hypothetical protein